LGYILGDFVTDASGHPDANDRFFTAQQGVNLMIKKIRRKNGIFTQY
jgi:hypothetical protein